MHITIIEDEKILSKNISKKLIKNWFSTRVFNWYEEFINEKIKYSDLYIIDISLIDWSGFDIIKHIRNDKKIEAPIIITSGYSDPEKKIYGLGIWADDYLTKPFLAEELIARIRALLRRSYKVNLNSNIKYNNIKYDTNKNILKQNWKPIEITYRELQFVEYMIFNIGKVIKKDEIIYSVWWEYNEEKISDNNINVVVSKIRKKLGDQFKLKTIKWVWYILEK